MELRLGKWQIKPNQAKRLQIKHLITKVSSSQILRKNNYSQNKLYIIRGIYYERHLTQLVRLTAIWKTRPYQYINVNFLILIILKTKNVGFLWGGVRDAQNWQKHQAENLPEISLRKICEFFSFCLDEKINNETPLKVLQTKFSKESSATYKLQDYRQVAKISKPY